MVFWRVRHYADSYENNVKGHRKKSIETSVKDIAKIMTEKKIGSVLIEDQGNIIGMIKENIRLSY